MAGAYCKFCGHRCFVERWVPDSGVTHWATCKRGMDLDRERSGHDYTTAFNPLADRHSGLSTLERYENWQKNNRENPCTL